MIDFNDVSKLLGGRDILHHASFRVNKGEKVGVVGPNGSGKTTVFSMIVGDISADSGEIILPEKVRIGLLRQQLSFFKESEPLLDFVKAADGELPRIQQRIDVLIQKIQENPADDAALKELGTLQSNFEHLGGYNMEYRASTALHGLGFQEKDLQKPMGEFSGGWQMRACMAKVLLSEPDILLLDEPSNYLDIPAVEWLQRKLKTYEGTLLLISHDRFLLNSLTDITMEVNGGKITRYPGNYNYYIKERENRRIQADAAQKNTERKKQKLEDNINRFRAKATKAAQVQSWLKMLDKIEDVELPEELHFHGRIRIPEPPHCGNEVLFLDQVSHTYDEKRWIFQNVSLSLMKGDKLGIVGYNGMGKSTLLKIIAGRFAPSSGNRKLGHKVIPGYQAQEFAELLPQNETAFDVVKQAAAGTDITGQRIRDILGTFGFSGEAAMKNCGVLSGGEKIRLCFARIFVNPPNLLILDEPTTHLDIAAREALQEAVKNYQGTVCLVSHDVEFLRGAVDEILEIKPGSVRRFQGNYDYYREKIAAEEMAEQEKMAKTANHKNTSSSALSDNSADMNQKERRKEKAQKRNEMMPEKRRLEKAVAEFEKIIENGEEEKNQILEQLSATDGNIDYESLQKRLKEIDYRISKATLDWEETALQLEELLKIYDNI